MRKTVVVALLSAVTLAAQTPDLTGVWKADLQKSKFNAPPGRTPTNYLTIIKRETVVVNPRTKETAPQFIETTGIWGERGQERSVLKVFENGKAAVLPYQGVPTRLALSSEGNILTINGQIAGRPDTFTRTYTLSPDGKALTLDISTTHDGKTMKSTVDLVRQTEDAGAPLRQPEELAGAHFKNVKTDSLKNLPVSEFINEMHYYAWSLNRNCEFCHVQRKFDSDDKKEKQTARKMIDMVASIDRNNFDGHPAVRCFTCHEEHAHPLRHPQFPEEAAAEKAAMEKAAAEHGQPTPATH